MKNKWLLLTGLVLIIGIIIFALISSLRNPFPGNGQKAKKIHVSASFYPLYFFASEIGGDKASVFNITPAGSEPHDYDPTTQDMARIESSQMLILNGGIEAWGDKIRANLKEKNVRIVIAGEGLVMQDPHIWLDPSLALKETERISQGFIAIDSANRNYYLINENKLKVKLNQLDREYKNGLKNCLRQDFVTSHAAFFYLAQSYGLKQIPISGLSPDQEPSARQMADVVNYVKKQGIKYIFFERLVSPKLAQTIAQEAGVKTLVLDPLEGISDNEIKQGENYFTVMRENLKNLQQALQCSR